jgi:hypothetical protein
MDLLPELERRDQHLPPPTMEQEEEVRWDDPCKSLDLLQRSRLLRRRQRKDSWDWEEEEPLNRQLLRRRPEEVQILTLVSSQRRASKQRCNREIKVRRECWEKYRISFLDGELFKLCHDSQESLSARNRRTGLAERTKICLLQSRE